MKEVENRRTQVKKCFPEWSGSAADFFSGFADSRNEGDQLFYLCPRPFQRRAFPAILNISLGEKRGQGECAEGWVVLNMILPGMLLGANFMEF